MDEFVRTDVFDARMKAVDDENNRQNHRIDKLEGALDKLNELASSVQLMANNIATMTTELKRQSDRLEEIEKEPGEKWRKLTWLIVTAVAGGLAGWILSRIGL